MLTAWKSKEKKYLFSLITIFVLCFLPFQILGYEIQKLDIAGPIQGDFILGPGKVELWMEPGQTVTKELYIINRIGNTVNFRVEIEDFQGSQDPNEAIVLLGDEKGPYSLKDYIHPELMEFTLKHGEKMSLPIEISIPLDAEPGGLYGTVLVTVESLGSDIKKKDKEQASAGLKFISRLGALYFIRVKGDIEESGKLESFKTDKKFYQKGPVSFQLLFENNGNVHLNPYGIIEIKNLFGKKTGEVKLDPWFALPDSLRTREIQWNKKLLIGPYTAVVKVNRGYQDIIDEKSIRFWVVPFKIILAGLAGLIIIISFSLFVFRRFRGNKGKKV